MKSRLLVRFLIVECITLKEVLRTLKFMGHRRYQRTTYDIEACVMNESSTFCLCYLSGIGTRFTKDEQNDDTILDDEVIGEVENFEQKVRPSGASSLRTLSQEEKRLFHWYIFNNVDEILEYRK